MSVLGGVVLGAISGWLPRQLPERWQIPAALSLGFVFAAYLIGQSDACRVLP